MVCWPDKYARDLAQLDDPRPFESALALMYGRETLEQALALFNQDERFFGLTKLGENFEGSAIHQRLLEAYRKVRATPALLLLPW